MLTNIYGSKNPTAIPIIFVIDPKVVARVHPSSPYHAAATFEGVLIKNGYAKEAKVYPIKTYIKLLSMNVSIHIPITVSTHPITSPTLVPYLSIM